MNEEEIARLEHDVDLLKREKAAHESRTAELVFVSCLVEAHKYCRGSVIVEGRHKQCRCSCHNLKGER